MFRVSSVHLQEALRYQFWCELHTAVDVGLTTCQHLQLQATYTKTASVLPPEDGWMLDARHMSRI
jgi:hypothetical protein